MSWKGIAFAKLDLEVCEVRIFVPAVVDISLGHFMMVLFRLLCLMTAMYLLVESVCDLLGLGAALSSPESGSDAVALGLRLLTPGILKVITGCR